MDRDWYKEIGGKGDPRIAEAYRTPNVFDAPNAPGPSRQPQGGPQGNGLVVPVIPPDKWIIWPGTSALQSSVAGGLSGDLNMTFKEHYLICAIALFARSQTFENQILAASSLGIKVQVQPATESLFTNGTSEAYVPFVGLTGGQLNPVPVYRVVLREDQWTLNLQNLSNTLYDPVVVLNARKLSQEQADRLIARR